MPRREGTCAPEFNTPSLTRDEFNFGSVAGRPVMLMFLDHDDPAQLRSQVSAVLRHRPLFDDRWASLFLVFRRREQAQAAGLALHGKGVRCLFDPDQEVARLYDIRMGLQQPFAYPSLVLLDRQLRVMRTLVGPACLGLVDALIQEVAHYHDARQRSKCLGMAPIIVTDRIFPPELCQALIAHYQQKGGGPSGVMRDVDGMTKGFFDESFKKRMDCTIDEPELLKHVQEAVGWRIRPLIRQAFHFEASRIERQIIACYDSAQGGFFSPHRDNGGEATRHRRFAVTINLNAEDYDGGDLYFPEYGDQTYRAPTGGAIVFSGSLLHGVTTVTRGTRYAYLPFLYGENDVKLREEGRQKLVDGVL